MRRGRKCGREDGPIDIVRLGIGMFVRRDGYTTVAVAVALLVSLSLVLATASVQWGASRAADIQEVADAAALSGSNCVAAFSTIAQVLDACVLSMGLLGVIVYGAGMVAAAIPILQESAPAILEAGEKILDARRGFARSAAEGIRRLEGALPALIAANSASCVQANSQGPVAYAGLAVPYPTESQSDFSSLEADVDDSEMKEAAEELRSASAEKEEADRRANEARERAWRADCVDDPMCMRSRAESLAGLSGPSNPDYPDVRTWKFDYARIRAVNYYRTRTQSEHPSSGSAEDVQRSAARREFYRYAAKTLSQATCVEEGDSVVLDLPELPHTTDMVKATTLYTDPIWPCTAEDGVRTLHCSLDCPGATGTGDGNASLADIDAGVVARCGTCRMDVAAMGNVADASTNINNGFEHYWRIVSEASKDYQKAVEDGKEAEQRMQEAAEKSESAFQRAMDALAVDRPKLCPPGAYGCIAFVMRGSEEELPGRLTGAFLSGASLPSGAAISAATLAPDDGTDGHNALSSVFDGLKSDDRSIMSGLVDGVADLWGSLLVGYGSAYEGMASAASDFLDGVGSVLGQRVASWLKGKIAKAVESAGLEPADMRMRKPVLVNSQKVLDKAGASQVAQVRTFVESLHEGGASIERSCIDEVLRQLGGVRFTIAEIPIPGGWGSVPLTIDLSTLGVGA